MRQAVPGGVPLVGVFVDEHPERMDELVEPVGLDRVQLHGVGAARRSSSASASARCAACATATSRSSRRACRGLRPRLAASRATSRRCRRTGAPPARIVAEWRVLLAGRARRRQRGAAVAAVQPYGVDVARGVERRPASRITTRAALRRRGQGGEHEHAERALARRARARRPRPLRPLRRALRPRDGDGGPRRARGGASHDALADPAFDAELRPLGPRLRRPPDAALPRRAADASTSAAPASTSSARTWRTRARTRSTTPSARRCSRVRLGKRRIVAETGAGQHGVASATVCARFGLDCIVYMGEEDTRRQRAQRGAHGPARRRGRAGHLRHRRRSRTP